LTGENAGTLARALNLALLARRQHPALPRWRIIKQIRRKFRLRPEDLTWLIGQFIEHKLAPARLSR
jgi:hypothetical protein